MGRQLYVGLPAGTRGLDGTWSLDWHTRDLVDVSIRMRYRHRTCDVQVCSCAGACGMKNMHAVQVVVGRHTRCTFPMHIERACTAWPIATTLSAQFEVSGHSRHTYLARTTPATHQIKFRINSLPYQEVWSLDGVACILETAEVTQRP